MLAQIDLRFKQAASPPATIHLHAERKRLLGTLDQYDVRAMLGDRVLATGSVTLAYPEEP